MRPDDIGASSGAFAPGASWADAVNGPDDARWFKIFDFDKKEFVGDGWLRSRELEDIDLSSGRFAAKAWGPQSGSTKWANGSVQADAEAESTVTVNGTDLPNSQSVTLDQLVDNSNLAPRAQVKVLIQREGETIVDTGFVPSQRLSDLSFTTSGSGEDTEVFMDTWVPGAGRSGWARNTVAGDKKDDDDDDETADIEGDESANELTGTQGDDRIKGGAGDDKLLGLAGDDELQGGTGNDRLKGGRGDDELTGGEGDDTFVFDFTSDDSSDEDTTSTDGDQTDGDQASAPALTESAGNGPDTVEGTGEADVLSGGNGPDRLFGLAGDDQLDGGNGPDMLVGGAGNDTLTGGRGPDSFVFDATTTSFGDENGDEGTGDDSGSETSTDSSDSTTDDSASESPDSTESDTDGSTGNSDVITDFAATTDSLIFTVADTSDSDDDSTTDGESETEDSTSEDSETSETTETEDSTDGGDETDGAEDSGDTDDKEDSSNELALPDGFSVTTNDAGDTVLTHPRGEVTLLGVTPGELNADNVSFTDDAVDANETGSNGDDEITDFTAEDDTIEFDVDDPETASLDTLVEEVEAFAEDGEQSSVALQTTRGEIEVIGSGITTDNWQDQIELA